MSSHINTNILKDFLVNNLNISKLSRGEAQKYDIKNDDFKEANKDENNYLELDEILDDKNLYEKFASLYVEEQEQNKETDKEKQKEEETKIQDKSGAGTAK